ncbi:MAG: hypothetical protein KDE54_29770 [Caldilineaceae bacterium]|nr:hypothetical protein [Caldilineaceae bacterium]MCB0144346.1 hypothetical protein [Caldilineaceae bacterium]
MAAYSTQDSENNRSQNNRDVPEESPELLRWRADALLDEMMLGGIDTSATSPTRTGPESTRIDQGTTSSFTANRTGQDAHSNGSFHDGGANNSAAPVDRQERPEAASYAESSHGPMGQPFHRPRSEWPDGSHQNGHSLQDAGQRQPDSANSHLSPPSFTRTDQHREPRDFHDAATRPWGQSTLPPTEVNPNEPPRGQSNEPARGQPDEPMLRPPSAMGGRNQPSPYNTSFLGPRPSNTNAVEQSTNFRQAGQYSQPNAYPPADQPAYPNVGRDDRAMAQTYGEQPGQSDPHEPFAVQKEPKPWSVVSGGPGDYLTSVPRRNDAPYNAPQTRYAYDPVLGPTAYQQQPARFADSMAVGAQAKRRTNVWPRHSRFDIQALQQEMNSLQEQIDVLVRRRLDISERAQHLLDKGRTILENDPDRSAEVTYYVQQVRTMVQRTGQRVQWSNVYRTRLFTYLTAWLALSIVILAGCILYHEPMRLWLSQFSAFAFDGFLSQHIIALLGTVASATLGSALAALINAWRHSQKEYGYFDRKYGMLGAVLPIIGMLVGLLLYLALGVLYWLFEISPIDTPVAAWIPAILAFSFGASQEKIYGTAE